jgi:hypothetical protein
VRFTHTLSLWTNQGVELPSFAAPPAQVPPTPALDAEIGMMGSHGQVVVVSQVMIPPPAPRYSLARIPLCTVQ